MIGQTARFLWLRWVLAVLLSLLWTTTGGAVAVAECSDSNQSLIAAKTPAQFAEGSSPSHPKVGRDTPLVFQSQQDHSDCLRGRNTMRPAQQPTRPTTRYGFSKVCGAAC
jgi:hypothetical protein